jgi:DNA-binding HxlR family transcriptional regulator
MSRTSAQSEPELNSKEIPASAVDARRMADFCPTYAQLMDLLSRRWMGLVLRVLMSGPHRFNQIMAAVPGLSDPLLAQRLRELQARNLVTRSVLPASPVGVEYELTEAGRDLERAVRALSDWAAKWWGQEGSASEPSTAEGPAAREAAG